MSLASRQEMLHGFAPTFPSWFGAVVTVVVHGLVGVAWIGFSSVSKDDKDLFIEMKQRSPTSIQARFVQIQKASPSTDEPTPQTAEAVFVKDPEKSKEKKKEKQNKNRHQTSSKPRQTTKQLLNFLGARADRFADIDKKKRQEQNQATSSPHHVSTLGRSLGSQNDLDNEQQAYMRKLHQFFNRGWKVPLFIEEEERKTLKAMVDVKVSENGKLQSIHIRSASGNAAFDQSVRSHLERIKNTDESIPMPPDSLKALVINKNVAIRFRGRDASAY